MIKYYMDKLLVIMESSPCSSKLVSSKLLKTLIFSCSLFISIFSLSAIAFQNEHRASIIVSPTTQKLTFIDVPGGGERPAPTPTRITVASIDTDGTYEIYWVADSVDPRFYKFKLQESKNGNNWSTIATINIGLVRHTVRNRAEASYRYRIEICDQYGGCSGYAYSGTVVVDFPPTISDISDRTINENSNTGYIGFTISDTQIAERSLSLTRTSSNTSIIPTGNIVFGGSGSNRSIKVTPAANKYGTVIITVKVSDGRYTNTDRFTVTVRSINDTPVINQGQSYSLSTDEDKAKSFTLSATDVDSSTLTWSIYSNPMHGSTGVSGSGASKTLTYTPVTNYNGNDSFRVRVSDGNSTDVITVNVTVKSINDAPVIRQGQSYILHITESTAKTFTLDVSDADSSTLTWSMSSNPTHGSIAVSGVGLSKTLTYRPVERYRGSDSFSVKVSDGSLTDVITINIISSTNIIFIHTDILGTPVAETDKNGVIQ